MPKSCCFSYHLWKLKLVSIGFSNLNQAIPNWVNTHPLPEKKRLIQLHSGSSFLKLRSPESVLSLRYLLSQNHFLQKNLSKISSTRRFRRGKLWGRQPSPKNLRAQHRQFTQKVRPLHAPVRISEACHNTNRFEILDQGDLPIRSALSLWKHLLEPERRAKMWCDEGDEALYL